MQVISLYIAGKVDPNSSFGTSHWRDKVCEELSRLSGITVTHLDPAKPAAGFEVDQNDPLLVVGRNAYMQKTADATLVYLSDDISVGGSQEMLIAKYLGKPLIGLAPRGGKFNKSERELFGKVWENYRDPYVALSCDRVAETLEEVAHYLTECATNGFPAPKDVSVFEEALRYYEANFRSRDSF